MTSLRIILAMCWKDIRSEIRSWELLSTMLVFALTVILIFVFAFDLSGELRRLLAPGVIWVTLCFSGTISLNRSMTAEREFGGMEGLMLVPADRNVIFISKLLVNWLYLLITAVVAIPAYAIFSSTSVFSLNLVWVIVLGTFGYAAAGTLLSALSAQVRTREMLLPVLLFPILIPLLLGVVRATNIIFQGRAAGEFTTWLMLIISFDLVFLAAGVMFFGLVLEE